MSGLFGNRPSAPNIPEPEEMPDVMVDDTEQDEARRIQSRRGRRGTIVTKNNMLDPGSVGKKSLLGG